MTGGANAAQAERWNGTGGRHWITNRERHLAGHQRLVWRLFDAAAISPGERVLDVGCGCGETTIVAARAAAAGLDGDGAALGVDLSAPMLEVARGLTDQAGLANVGFIQADAQVYPLSPGFYDVMISSFGVMFFADPAAAFANVATALRPRGRLAFLCWQDDLSNELFGLVLRAFAPWTRPPEVAGRDLFENPRRVEDLLSGAGWAGIEVRPVSQPAWMGSDVADVMAYVRDMRLVRTLADQLGDEGLTERALAAVADDYASRQRPDGVWVQAAAWLVTATLSPG